MLKICLTGSIATGKTTVSRLMAENGAIIIDTDLLTHAAYKYPSPASEKIIQYFGEEFLLEGHIDRKKLAARVFSKPEDLKVLNSIVHPFIYSEVGRLSQYYENLAKENQKNYLLVYVIPLFFETNSKYQVDHIVLAACSPENQLKRLIAREGYSKEEAVRRINSQMPIELKISKSDFVIDTNQSIDIIKNEVRELLNKFVWDTFDEK